MTKNVYSYFSPKTSWLRFPEMIFSHKYGLYFNTFQYQYLTPVISPPPQKKTFLSVCVRNKMF